ncbi:MAG: TetR/AcrR family transcriptional regulator [Proteobacteria bacterium]|nr:TetR/AcrR family transcriptional regulator [Pseudomonadota bacterium]
MVTKVAPTSRRERRRQEVHDRIMQAAIALFTERGIAATTIDQIVEAADVAQKTFFNHFPTKQHLFAELAEGRVERLYALFETERKRKGSFQSRLKHGFLRLAEEAEAEERLARDLIQEVLRISPFEGAAPGDRNKLLGAFEALLEDGREAGDVRKDLSLPFLAEMLLGTFGSIMTNWVSLPHYPLKRRLGEAATLLGDAMAPQRVR